VKPDLHSWGARLRFWFKHLRVAATCHAPVTATNRVYMTLTSGPRNTDLELSGDTGTPPLASSHPACVSSWFCPQPVYRCRYGSLIIQPCFPWSLGERTTQGLGFSNLLCVSEQDTLCGTPAGTSVAARSGYRFEVLVPRLPRSAAAAYLASLTTEAPILTTS